ncbi:MAG: thioredoxin-disulfide reductase [Lachnospiraceae bacterium]|nr:thioredoxin-disulfide reductase [Lachnospiraceae bacterium]
MYDIIIIGSGPAGLAAAIYAGRAKRKALVLESAPMSGGQIINTYEVDNYPGIEGISGFELGQKMRQHADRMGVPFLMTEVLAVEKGDECKLVRTKDEVLESRTVIFATGATYRKLGVPGEEALRGLGVSYCATCDGAFFRGRTVAVVGGGDVALEDALFLARGCEKVYLIHRRDSFRGAKVLQEQVMAQERIEILYDTEVISIGGTESVSNITIFNRKKGEQKKLAVQGIFLAVGITPASELAIGLVELDENGYIIAGEDCAASLSGIYAAGDVRTKQLRQVVTAVSDGANAVTSAERYLNGQQ